MRTPTSVNNDPMKQPDEQLRALNTQPSDAGTRARRSTARRSARTHPDEMYIVAAHMDGTAGAKPPTTMDPARRW